MHYFKLNIGDWMSHTSHLSQSEELAFFKMLLWQYLHEKPLPLDVDMIARFIGMRDQYESITFVLETLFDRTENGYTNKRAMRELDEYKAKSEKARQSVNARWQKKNTTVLRTNNDSNTNHKPITNNHKPSNKAFRPPTLAEVKTYCESRNNGVEPQRFIDFYESKGWMVGKNKMKNWQAAVRNWEQNSAPQQKGIEWE